MTVLESVRKLIVRIAPDAMCDDCIAIALKISPRQHANHKTRELASVPGFVRAKGVCLGCEKDGKLVMRKA